MSDDLPAGWLQLALDSVAERITKGSTPTSYGYAFLPTGINFIKVENLKNGRVNHASLHHFISREAHNSQGRSILGAGDILCNSSGPYAC